MSGGHYNYAYGRVVQFLEEMELEPANIEEHDEDGKLIFVEPGFDPYINYDLRKRFKDHLEKVAAAMRAIEWNDSGDGASKEAELILACLQGPDLGDD